jgi:outer membrane protein
MKKLLVLALLATIFCTAATPSSTKVCVVNFKSCVEGSKLGKKEQAHFDEMKKQFETEIEAKEKEINDMAPKFSADYLDTLTPEAETELKSKFARLNQEHQQKQNQYYNLLQQANYQIIHKLSESIAKASEKVAKAKGFDMALNEEACFYFAPSFDISKEVITELDVVFDAAVKEAAKADKK